MLYISILYQPLLNIQYIYLEIIVLKVLIKTISAFANDIDNWGGGYLVIGVKEENGKIIRPISDLKEDEIDTIQKELLQYCNYLKPKYIPQTETVYFDGKALLLIWCPGGYERPYQCPKKPTSKSKKLITSENYLVRLKLLI